MSATAIHTNDASHDPAVDTIRMKLEVVTLPVVDPDRAKVFYANLGWRLDADVSQDGDRVVQFTPPGSQCSIHFGAKVTSTEHGSVQVLYLVVSDILAARDDLARRGIDVSEVFHYIGGPARFGTRIHGLAPGRISYGSYASFDDPDGNSWLLQEVTARLPGRIDPAMTAFDSPGDLASALRRASAAHNEHEQRIGRADTEGWPEWYAAYMVAEQSGAELPS
jgi:catechol 2,3-dioxygenase-like lactoylglutathione lyase family enzyme